MSNRITRRTFVKHVAVAGASLPVAMPRLVRAASPNGKLNLAGIGVAGKGWSDLNNTSHGQNVVAICDIDRHRLAQMANRVPGATAYSDWRKLLERKDVEAVTISTPDHMHAPIAMTAMRRGIHVYVQKPLTHSVYEARRLTETAREAGVVTQMGIQGHSGADVKQTVQLLRDRAVGGIREVHVWTNRPIWPQGMDRPAASQRVPDHLDWDGWLGVAPERPYVGGTYHPFVWRGWLDFGTGALGDIACHSFDPIVSGLKLGPPRAVWCEGPRPNAESFPDWSIVHFRFAPTPYTDGELHLVWYDGGKRPPDELFPQGTGRFPENGTIYVGEEGLLTRGLREPLWPRDKFADYPLPEVEPDDHYMQWTRACLGEDRTSTPIDTYSGPLTETVLVGNVSLWYGEQRLEWSAEEFRFTNLTEANRHLRREYRKGWEVEGLS